MSYTIVHEVKEYWDEFIDSAYLPDGLSRGELRNIQETIYTVELSIALMQAIELTDEPLEILSALINWTAIDYKLYAGLANPALLKRNAARLQTLRSINGWSQALVTYLSLPIQIRLFDLPNLVPVEMSRQVMQQLKFQDIVCHSNDQRINFLNTRLYHPVSRPKQSFTFAQRPGIHQAWVNGLQLEFDLREEDINSVDSLFEDMPYLARQREKPRQSFCLKIPDDLQSVATQLGPPWPDLLASINFRTVDNKGFSESNAMPIILNDEQHFLHLVGMTGARKSVLATLIAGWAIEQTLATGIMHRVALIFTTISEALHRAELLNKAFRDDIEQLPVAVPIFGESGREKQILRFFESTELPGEQPAWAERFLASGCPLQARLTADSRKALAGKAIPAGSEPCTRLKHPEQQSMDYVCPFFARCPSRQRYGDLATAPVWIVNPWTYGLTRIPRPFIRENPTQHQGYDLRVMELVAGQADLVIVDESDVTQNALDDIWGPTIGLYGGRKGLYDGNITAVVSYDQQQRLEAAGNPWVRNFISGWESVNVASAMLTDARYGKVLSDWIKQDFITLEYLLDRLAHKLTGIPVGTYLAADQQAYLDKRFGELTGNLLDILRSIMGGTPVPDTEPQLNEARRELLALRRALLAISNHRHIRVRSMARAWLKKWVLAPQGKQLPDYEARVREIANYLGWVKYQPETNETLESLLLFALALSNLRYYTLLVTERWEARPEIPGLKVDPMARAPYYADGLLPAPPLGQMFGFRIQRNEAMDGDDGILIQAAEHRAIGRGALFELTHLLEATEGLPGPCVMTLSATSYMPGSAQFHQHVPPGGILEPYPPGTSSPTQLHPVTQSTLVFSPVHDADGKPIFISGRPDKESSLRRMASRMAENLLPAILEDLDYRAQKYPASWADRQRIVLFPNSYYQAEAMAIPLAMSRLFEHVFLMVRETHPLPHGIRPVTLTDIETIGMQTAGESVALIAPLKAIGRGLNMLNKNGKAAFGAAIFATRYYPPPGEFSTMVEAMHAATYQGRDTTTDRAYHNLRKLRNRIRRVKVAAESDKPYSRLSMKARAALAADTTALISQAAGRLVRGVPDMVPFIAYFTDAAWAPRSAQGESDTDETSLLLAMQDYMADQVKTDVVFRVAHGPLFQALNEMKGVNRA